MSITMRMVGDKEPLDPADGDCWWDPKTGFAYIWISGAWFRLVSNTEEFRGVYFIPEEP